MGSINYNPTSPKEDVRQRNQKLMNKYDLKKKISYQTLEAALSYPRSPKGNRSSRDSRRI